MKFIKKLLIVFLVLGFVGSCNNLDLDLQDNPNQISPEQGSLNELYNAIQISFNDVFVSAEGNPGAMTRMYTSVNFSYRAATTNTTFNGLWGNAYNELFPDVDALIALDVDGNFDIHVGTAMIMKAYTMMVLVDLLGDVPYSEALQGTDVISPKADSGSDVYTAAISMLNDAIILLQGTTAPEPEFDNYYSGSAAGWVTAANTLKLRAALNMGDAGMFNSVISGGDYIDSESEDFQYSYGSQRNNPNSRHPRYNNHYETGDGAYLSNYYMWLLKADKEDGAGIAQIDPRIRYYFYRKVDDAVGQDATTYSCHFSALPDQAFQPPHWVPVDPRLPYCVASADGYSGRDHLNGEGIPPDGIIRTSWGLYPFGGDFDDDTFDDTRESGTSGGLGLGVSPLMLSSYVDLMRAEAVLSMGASGDARVLLESGIRKSLDKVEGYESLVSSKMGTEVELRSGETGTVKELYGMDAGSKDNYVNLVLGIYDAASAADKLAIVVKEYYIAAWGNGLEAYNMYKRTGYPSNMEPALEPDVGVFPLSFFYPANSVTRNANISQKAELNVPVFWQDASVASGLY